MPPWTPVSRWVSKLERYLARGRGYDLLQLTLRNLIFDEGIDLVLDIGANRGQYRDLLRDIVGYDGEILSFEPIPELVAHLQARSRSDPAWRVHGYALGDRDGETVLSVARYDVFTSQLTPTSFGATLYPAMRPVGQATVGVHRLDTVLPELLPDWTERRILLKTDTQGADLAVLEGAGAILDAVPLLQIEVAFLPLYEGTRHAHETLAWLDAHGFDPCGFYSVAGRDRGRIIEADCVLINRAFV